MGDRALRYIIAIGLLFTSYSTASAPVYASDLQLSGTTIINQLDPNFWDQARQFIANSCAMNPDHDGCDQTAISGALGDAIGIRRCDFDGENFIVCAPEDVPSEPVSAQKSIGQTGSIITVFEVDNDLYVLDSRRDGHDLYVLGNTGLEYVEFSGPGYSIRDILGDNMGLLQIEVQ